MQMPSILTFPESLWERVSKIAYKLLPNDITVPSAEIFIAALAMENKCMLFHYDEHFKIIANHVSLEIFPML